MLNRRHFLQFAGATLAAGAGLHRHLLAQLTSHAQVLSQRTPRKLALLVGINDYQNDLNPLYGCLTDVELQYQLLVHRYGFLPQDIVRLTDTTAQKPTRINILTAFEEHLIKSAQPGDVVVFHYSGHGSQLQDPQPLTADGLNGTIVPAEGQNDIMGRTLFLLLSALPTSQVTTLLDSCFSGGGLRGTVQFRSINSRLARGSELPSALELDYQEQWRSRLGWSPTDFQARRQRGIAQGIAIGSARRDQLAADARFEGFFAGALTYLLTRYLWQLPLNQPIERVFVDLQRSTKDVANVNGVAQEPVFEAAIAGDRQELPYFLSLARPAAEAVVLKQEGAQVYFWLGGVSAQSLRNFTSGAILTTIARENQPAVDIEQLQREGLRGLGRIISGAGTVQPGDLLREKIRGVPPDLNLRVGLDQSLGAERAQWQAALQTLTGLTTVPVEPGRSLDIILGRLTVDPAPTSRPEPPSGNRWGLLTPSLTPIAASFGPAAEPLSTAIARLTVKLKTLLATRLLKSLVNEQASTLNVTTQLYPVGQAPPPQPMQGSRAAQETGQFSRLPTVAAVQFAPETTLQLRVENQEQRDLYLAVLIIMGNGDLAVLFPYWDAPEDAARIAAGQTITVPRPDDRFRFTVKGPAGFAELLILASVTPLRDALRGLNAIATQRGTRSGNPTVLQGDDPLTMMNALLGDMDRATRSSPIKVRPRVQALDVNKFAVFSTTIEVVEAD
ncbi:caspase family protein [Spirulina major CS-329]|uniref:caspase family protein n=1 Tax=Spirulina TaxID=1154 RepID=UPI00232BCC94|nr:MULTISPECIES: caspase family protein [Spirulina]MDB9496582.1 caspase family protein [Spirulina subsalsa CS-330]MDB9503024.1 caspase family protein [Spirulina major CS-329]